MQSLLSNHRAQATRKPCLNSHNRDHSRKLVSVEGGDCSKRSNFGCYFWGLTGNQQEHYSIFSLWGGGSPKQGPAHFRLDAFWVVSQEVPFSFCPRLSFFLRFLSGKPRD